MNEIELMKSMGLKENEAKVYLASLSLGSATANDISYKAELLRTTTYELLKKLKEKGLCTEFEKGNIKYFEMVDPKFLLDQSKKTIAEFESNLKKLQTIKETSGRRPKIELYTGYKGIQNLIELHLAEKKPVRLLGNIELSNKFLGPYRDQYIRKRIEAGIKAKVLIEKGQTAAEYKKHDSRSYRETKTTKMAQKLESTYYCFGNKLAIFVFEKSDPMAVLIHNQKIAESFNMIFDEIWSQAQ